MEERQRPRDTVQEDILAKIDQYEEADKIRRCDTEDRPDNCYNRLGNSVIRRFVWFDEGLIDNPNILLGSD